MSLKPLFDRVVIKDAEMEETTKGGLIRTSTAKEKPQYAFVVAQALTQAQALTLEAGLTTAEVQSPARAAVSMSRF